MFKDKSIWIVIVLLLAAILIGILPAIYNGFPLLNSDSGAYIGFTKMKSSPIDRSIFYSYFIIWLGWKETIQFTIIAQSIIGTSLIYLLLRNHFNKLKSALITFITILLLSMLTPYSWFVSQLCPDIFMAFFALAFIGILWYKPTSKVTIIYYYFVILLSASIHNSILLFCIVYCGIGLLFAIIKRNKYFMQNFIFILLGVLSVYIVASWINYYHHKKFTPNPSSHIFIMSRIAEMGILNQVLEHKCDKKNYELCNYPKFEGRQWDFMWVNNYPHQQKGWLDKSVINEYKEINKLTLTTKKYLLEYIRINFQDAMLTLKGTNVNNGLDKFEANSSPWIHIENFSRNDFPFFKSARQQNNGLPFESINSIIKYGTWLLSCFVIILYIFNDKRNKFKHLPLLLFVFSILFLNSFITTSLSTYLDRFNARIIWILPFCVFLAILKAKNYHQQNNYEQQNN